MPTVATACERAKLEIIWYLCNARLAFSHKVLEVFRYCYSVKAHKVGVIHVAEMCYGCKG